MKRTSLFFCLMLLVLATGCLATSCRNTDPPEGTEGTTASTTAVTTASTTAPTTTVVTTPAVTTTAPSASDTTSRDYEVDIEDILRG